MNRCEGVKEVHDHFEEYQRRMFGGVANNNNNHHNGVLGEKNDETTARSVHDDHHNSDAHSTSSTSTTSHPPSKCQRPKLFFLKKRPPFANSNDGWNLTTQHRLQLFEPPSSMEGVGRGYGEVRGQLGDYCTVNYASPKFTQNGGNRMMSMKKGYKIFQRSKSLPVRAVGGGSSSSTVYGSNNNHACNDACGSVCGETEVSFLSANSGRRSPVVRMTSNGNHIRSGSNGNGGRSDGDSEAGRSLSPLQWVNGSEIKGVMNNWFG